MPSDESFPDRILPFQFAGRRLTVADLLEATSRVLSILREVDARTTGARQGSLDWVIREMRSGSAIIEVQAEPKGEDTPIWAASAVVRRFRQGMRQVIETGERPEAFSEYAMRRVYELTALLSENGIESLRIGPDGDSVVLQPGMRKALRDTLEGRYRAIGSIEGRIDSLSAHEEPYFCTVYTLLSGEPVRCYFASALLDTVYEHFRARVVVRGTLNTRADGEVTSMRLVSVDRMPDDDTLPTVDEIIGILSNGD